MLPPAIGKRAKGYRPRDRHFPRGSAPPLAFWTPPEASPAERDCGIIREEEGAGTSFGSSTASGRSKAERRKDGKGQLRTFGTFPATDFTL